MRLPTPLLRNQRNVHKNQFGHVLMLAGSRDMLGAAALCALAAMRTGAGLVTVGVPKSLAPILQKKLSSVVMTLSLPETKTRRLSRAACETVLKLSGKFSAIAVGPGLSQAPGTKHFVRELVTRANVPLVIDADGLNAIVGHLDVLTKTSSSKILTPHLGEMGRLVGIFRDDVGDHRHQIAKSFARDHQCVLLLKGPRTIVASPDGKVAVNNTGNAGLATAGSGDVLTGMIAALLGQGVSAFESARWGAYLHGLAADLAVKKIPKASLIASDLVDYIPTAIKSCR